MLIVVRTTVVLDDELVKKAKKRAAELKTTLSEVINQALRDAFTKPLPKRKPFKVITYGEGLPPAHHTPEDIARMIEEEDLQFYRDRSRR